MNALPSISTADAGIVIELSLHPTKARSPIFFSFDRPSNVITASFKHDSKHLSPIFSTDSGTLNDVIDEQQEKADPPISLKFVPLSKMTFVSEEN
jgi:hypothetical protein